jgi:hypothetical protein
VFWFGSHPENLSFAKVSILVHPKKSTFFKTVFGLQHEMSCFCNVDFSANLVGRQKNRLHEKSSFHSVPLESHQ